VTTALPITYEEPEPEKKSWFFSATCSLPSKQLQQAKYITVVYPSDV
jgi:hypothetical protein